MRTWRRTSHTRRCSCGAELEVGDPIEFITITGLSRALVRCGKCDPPAPPDLPDLPARTDRREPLTRPMQSIASMLPLDWKARGAGDREPGEEG